eukprot:751198-Hanusia_phi.AAC.7
MVTRAEEGGNVRGGESAANGGQSFSYRLIQRVRGAGDGAKGRSGMERRRQQMGETRPGKENSAVHESRDKHRREGGSEQGREARRKAGRPGGGSQGLGRLLVDGEADGGGGGGEAESRIERDMRLRKGLEQRRRTSQAGAVGLPGGEAVKTIPPGPAVRRAKEGELQGRSRGETWERWGRSEGEAGGARSGKGRGGDMLGSGKEVQSGARDLWM